MKICTSVLVSSLALFQLANAWTIESTAAETPSSSLGDHQELAKTWTVSGDDKLTSLDFGAIGRVFVDYDSSLASGTVAKVVVSGDSSALLDVVDVANVKGDASALKFQLHNKNLKDKGYLLTQVYVSSKQAVATLTLSRSGDVVVGGDVLVQSDAAASLNLMVTGSGNIYGGAETTSFDLGALGVSTTGDGDVQFLAENLKVKSLLGVGIYGSGDAAVVAKEITVEGAVEAKVAGSGDVFVQSEKLTAANLNTNIIGTGDVTYSRDGSVQQQTIITAGSGSVSAGSIAAVDTKVTIIGSGDVLVQTSGTLQVESEYSGETRYYGTKPSSISVTGVYADKQKAVTEAKKNHFDEFEVASLPARKPVLLDVEVSASGFFSSEPKLKHLIEAADSTDLNAFATQTQSLAIQATHQAPVIGVFAFVGLALAAVGVAASKYKTRTEREKYAPLV